MAMGGRITIETKNVTSIGITCSVQEDEIAAGDYVMLSVTDTGSGMTPEVAKRALRAVFHHQAGGQGVRPRPEHGLWLHQAVERPYQDLQRGRPGNGREDVFSAQRPAVGGRGAWPCSRPRPVVTSASSSGKTKMRCAPSSASSCEAWVTRCGWQPMQNRRWPCFAPTSSTFLLTDVVVPGRLNGKGLADEVGAARAALRESRSCPATPESALLNDGRLDGGVMLLAKPHQKADLARIIAQGPRPGGGQGPRMPRCKVESWASDS